MWAQSKSVKTLVNAYYILITFRLLSKVSPSEKYKAVIRDYDGKKYLEVWDTNSYMMRVVDLNAINDSNVHGAVYTDGKYT